MALQPDDTVCFCFHVSLRKVETFCKTQKPQHASQISDCLSAGTGCGWCVPLLKKLHYKYCGSTLPWWRSPPSSPPSSPTSPASPSTSAHPEVNWDELTAEIHAGGRAKYLAQGHGTPPAEPQP